MLLPRALFAFLALPGVVAFIVPVALERAQWHAASARPIAALLLIPGAAGLLSCVWAFYSTGKGTLAPWSPRKTLVTVGLYQYSRNPMYLSVLALLLGWAALFLSSTLLLYALCVVVAFHLRVVLAEEPWQARTFGQDWQAYAARVPRWLGRSHAPPPSDA